MHLVKALLLLLSFVIKLEQILVLACTIHSMVLIPKTGEKKPHTEERKQIKHEGLCQMTVLSVSGLFKKKLIMFGGLIDWTYSISMMA